MNAMDANRRVMTRPTDYGRAVSRRVARRLVACTLALGGALAAYHFVLMWLMRHAGLVLGVVRPSEKVYRLVPLYCEMDPPHRLNPGLLAVVGLLVMFWRWLSRVAWDPRRLRRGFVPAAMAWYVALACLVAMIDGGPSRIGRPYEKLRETDYLGAVGRVESVGHFLSHYTELQPSLPLHCRTHPPGGILFLCAIEHWGWPGATAAALATIFFAALAVPAVHGLAREVGTRRTARLATVLFLLAPNVLLFTATSMEAVFMAPMIWTFYLLFRATRERPVVLGFAGGLTASAAAFMTFSAAWLAIWAVMTAVLVVLIDRRRMRNTLLAMAGAAAASLAFHGLLYLASGYNPWAVLGKALGQHTQIMSGGNQTTLRQYLHMTVANPIAFFAGTGLVLAVLWAARTWSDAREGFANTFTTRHDSSPSYSGRNVAGRLLNLSFLGSLAVVALAPLYTLEVERIWIFLVPLVAIAAARELQKGSELFSVRLGKDRANVAGINSSDPFLAVRATFVLLAGQTVLMEALLDTLW